MQNRSGVCDVEAAVFVSSGLYYYSGCSQYQKLFVFCVWLSGRICVCVGVVCSQAWQGNCFLHGYCCFTRKRPGCSGVKREPRSLVERSVPVHVRWPWWLVSSKKASVWGRGCAQCFFVSLWCKCLGAAFISAALWMWSLTAEAHRYTMCLCWGKDEDEACCRGEESLFDHVSYNVQQTGGRRLQILASASVESAVCIWNKILLCNINI